MAERSTGFSEIGADSWRIPNQRELERTKTPCSRNKNSKKYLTEIVIQNRKYKSETPNGEINFIFQILYFCFQF
jgi:hypothetical protein